MNFLFICEIVIQIFLISFILIEKNLARDFFLDLINPSILLLVPSLDKLYFKPYSLEVLTN
jgi:hypothetical protein